MKAQFKYTPRLEQEIEGGRLPLCSRFPTGNKAAHEL